MEVAGVRTNNVPTEVPLKDGKSDTSASKITPIIFTV